MNNESSSYYYLITIAYDGSDFAGWATQPNKFTVQGYIEEILSKIFQQKISILATSRTDKGVHAREQKLTFRINLLFSNKNLLSILKKALNKHILVKRVEKVSEDFHPIRNVINKEYRYFINSGKMNIFQKKYRWEYNLPLEVEKLNRILKIFQGKHNFFNYCYCRWNEQEKVITEREIISLKSWKKANIIIISIIAKGFLRYQIRAIIGEVINCYKEGGNTIGIKEKLINYNKKNYKYKNIAPANGLYLWKINH
ncbi:MAG: tRNA pseudouridine synthase A [Mycoplasmataceae bacterium]|nr:MAG: tRNA pseudouridine synthase A [Mycoplasmataceae bacterium]